MKRIIQITLTFSLFLFACKKDKLVSPEPVPVTKDKISGSSQKGPFLNGSSVTVFELDSNFSQTGKSFQTQIVDNSGLFEIHNISLVTGYAKLKADGFYFNEIINSNSLAPLTLYALSDISEKHSVNVNLLTTLEVSRIEYLIHNGWTFNNAKVQAQQEILEIFFIHKSIVPESETLDISQDGDDNAILLAISILLQGYRTESELSQLIADISTDIRTDGVLNSSSLGSALINDAVFLKLPSIRSNIENKYVSLGITTTISDFEKYVNKFLDSTTYTFTNNITYPKSGPSGLNLLNTTDSIIPPGTYSFCANLPKGTTLTIEHDGNLGALGFHVGSLQGWDDLGSGANPSTRKLASTLTGQINLKAQTQYGSITLKFYENGSANPTRIKTVKVQ